MFIAHDLSMVRYVSDDIGVMYLGQLVETSTSEELYSHPLHPYTKGLMDSVPVADPKLARQKEKSSIEGDIPSPIQSAVRMPFPHPLPICHRGVPARRCRI